jgi:uncharacterized protein involved in oxidation of intracellular sulfur
MSEEKEKMVYIVTRAGEDPERATFPFLMANAGLAMEVEATIFLQGTGVYLGKKGYAEHVQAPGQAPLKELLNSFLANGGKLMVCIPCIQERKIDPADLVEGAELTKAGKLIVAITGAKATLVY